MERDEHADETFTVDDLIKSYQSERARENMRAMSRFLKDHEESMLEVGFTEEQAMLMTTSLHDAWIRLIIGRIQEAAKE